MPCSVFQYATVRLTTTQALNAKIMEAMSVLNMHSQQDDEAQ